MWPNSFRLTAIPFPQMRSALNNGQVDAIWVPEPFLSQGLNIDNARIVMAPGPVLGRYWPIGGYAARQSWRSRNPALAERFRKAINRSLTYAQSHPDEVRAMLPANAQNSRLPIWSPVIDRGKLSQLASYARKYDVITRAPNLRQLVPNSIASGLVLQGTVQARRVLLRHEGRTVTRLTAGPYTFVVTDNLRNRDFVLRDRASTGARACGARPQHLDREPPARDVPVLVVLDAGREEELPRHVAVTGEGAFAAPSPSRRERLRRRDHDVEEERLVSVSECRNDLVERLDELAVLRDPLCVAALSPREPGDVDVERRPGPAPAWRSASRSMIAYPPFDRITNSGPTP